jgi:hypothetical protein
MEGRDTPAERPRPAPGQASSRSCQTGTDDLQTRFGPNVRRWGTGGSQTHPWRGQSRANPSLKPKFPASRENAGNFIDSGLRGVSMVAKTRRQISNLRVNSLRIGTGNFLRPCRELNQAIREISALIRETAMTAKRLTGSGTRR